MASTVEGCFERPAVVCRVSPGCPQSELRQAEDDTPQQFEKCPSLAPVMGQMDESHRALASLAAGKDC
jgi:hypothetical protein